MSDLTAIDLCCGAGGWACAARGLPIKFVAVADYAADCLETWALNHRAAHTGCELLRVDLSTPEGIREVLEAAGQVDMVLGAIPCEQFSNARANRPLQEGELKAVHSLIDNCLGLTRELNPRFWCFEDVTEVEPHLPGPLQLGIPYEARVVRAHQYGPQKRKRLFFGSFPPLADPEPGPRILGDVLRPGPYRTLPQIDKYERSKSKWYGGDKIRVQDADKPSATVISSQGGMGSRAERSAMVPMMRVMDPGEPAPTIADFSSRHERGAMVGAQARELDPAKPSPTVTSSFRCDYRTVPITDATAEWPRSCDRPQSADRPSRTIADGKGGGKGLPVQQSEDLVRVMEWQEAALLQGFPADYVFAASWSRTWKLVAQAIPVYVGRAILRSICASAFERRRPVRRGQA